MLAQPNTLPSAQIQFAVGNGHCQVRPEKACLHMCRHVIRSFARVPERHVLWHDSVEHHFHVVSHVRVPILVDGQAG